MTTMRLRNGRAIDPGAGLVIEQATILIQDGRIVEIAEASGDAPEGALDLAGKTVLPGLIDAHTHLSSDLSRSPGFGPGPSVTARIRGRVSSAGSS
jgi:imidazolonepropionase-like amidohydrolase